MLNEELKTGRETGDECSAMVAPYLRGYGHYSGEKETADSVAKGNAT